MRKGVTVALGSAMLFGMSTPTGQDSRGQHTAAHPGGAALCRIGCGTGAHPGRPAPLWRPREALISLPRRGEWLWLVGAIFFGGVLGPVALMYGLVTSAASTASLLLNLEAVLTALLAWFLFRENFDRRVMLGMFGIVAGGVLLVWTPSAQNEVSFGWIFIALACLCWAIDNNLTRKVSASDAMLIAGLKGLVAGAVNVGLALVIGQTLPSLDALGLALAVGFLGYGVSLALFVLALRHLGTARAGAYFAVAPFFGAALAVVTQGDAVTWQLIAAGLLMSGGVWLHLTEHHGHLHAHEREEHTHAPIRTTSTTSIPTRLLGTGANRTVTRTFIRRWCTLTHTIPTCIIGTHTNGTLYRGVHFEPVPNAETGERMSDWSVMKKHIGFLGIALLSSAITGGTAMAETIGFSRRVARGLDLGRHRARYASLDCRGGADGTKRAERAQAVR